MESLRKKNRENGRLIMGLCSAFFFITVSCILALADGGGDLLKAIRLGEIEHVRSLIDKKVDLSVRDNRDKTPLMVAAYNNKLQIAKLLIENGAKLEEIDEKGYRRTALLFAASRRHIDIIKLLSEKGADLNAADKLGITAMMLAAKNVDIVSFLLDKGGNFKAKDVDGWTALVYAASSGYFQSAFSSKSLKGF